jgi:hypothetical protein
LQQHGPRRRGRPNIVNTWNNSSFRSQCSAPCRLQTCWPGRGDRTTRTFGLRRRSHWFGFDSSPHRYQRCGQLQAASITRVVAHTRIKRLAEILDQIRPATHLRAATSLYSGRPEGTTASKERTTTLELQKAVSSSSFFKFLSRCDRTEHEFQHTTTKEQAIMRNSSSL